MSQLKESTTPQPNSTKAMHYAALKATVQAAINLELFTIPLYMTSMYSLVGTHQITGKNELYRGRWWPGAAPTFNTKEWEYDALNPRHPQDVANKLPIDKSLFSATNNRIFNLIFKVFIEEMLHLQLAGNMAKTLGLDEPTFTHKDLINDQSYAWECYGDNSTILPYIVDLKDTITFDKIKVKLGPLDHNQINLFQAIEMADEDAVNNIKKEEKGKYFPTIPYAGWNSESKGTENLPMFGSIGHLYVCLWGYLNLEFEDGDILLDYILEEDDDYNPVNRQAPIPQRNIFKQDMKEDGKIVTKNEYSGFSPTISPRANTIQVLAKVKDMINAITDQGEGSEVAKKIVTGSRAVSDQFQINEDVVKQRKSYNDEGRPVPSRSANARAGLGTSLDHEEIFDIISDLMKASDFKTWDQWHAEGNKWTADLLESKDYENNEYKKNLPEPQAVADAMNRLKNGGEKSDPAKTKENYDTMCKAASGAIWGIVSVLNDYWSYKTYEKGKRVHFPYPSMGGSGDRMSICWAVFGKLPDIRLGLSLSNPDERRVSRIVHNSCQHLSLDPDKKKNGNDSDTCARVSIYHTCKGSNQCAAEGGCGFIQKVGGGNNCSGAKLAEENTTDPKTLFSPPADNACGGQGGCAVPISDAQLFPKLPNDPNAGKLQLFDFKYYIDKEGVQQFTRTALQNKDKTPITISYKEGDHVYDVAWAAYSAVLTHRGAKLPQKPKPSDFRLAFPPST